MSSIAGPPSLTPNETPPSAPRTSRLRELGALLVLVCVAVVVGVLDLLAQGTVPSWSAVAASWSWVLGVILVILAIIIVLWVVRLTLRAAGVPPREDRRERRRRRWEAAPSAPDADPAVEIARERYARGEISQDDLNRILRQLGKGS